MSDSPARATAHPCSSRGGRTSARGQGRCGAGREAAGCCEPGLQSAGCRCSGVGGEPLYPVPLASSGPSQAGPRPRVRESPRRGAGLFRREHVVAAGGSRPRERLSGYVGDLGAPRRRASQPKRTKLFFIRVLGSWTFSGDFQEPHVGASAAPGPFWPGSASWPTVWNLIFSRAD